MRVLAIAVLAWTAWSGAALSAQVSPSSSGRDYLSLIVDEFGDCVVQMRPDEARALVLSDDWWNQHDRIARLRRTRCGATLAENGATFIPDMPVGAIAAALVREDFRSSGPVSFADHAPLVATTSPDYRRAERLSVRERTRLNALALYARERARTARVGECIVGAEPEASRAWIVSLAQNPAPSAALAPAMAECLRQDSRAGIDPNSVALSYYRIATSTLRQTNGATN